MRKQIRFGIIGLGLMGKEFASAAARWCHLLTDGPVPVITAICNSRTESDRKWFTDNFPHIDIVTSDYREIIRSELVDAVYCAVPHHLHRDLYIDILQAGKHLLGEKPFGIDGDANAEIAETVKSHPELVVKCSSEFPYYPGAKQMIEWIQHGNYGRLMEVRCGFHHCSDLDLQKPINWKRQIAYNGEYGCMGDLGFHTQHIPLRMGWKIKTVFANLQNIATERPAGKGTSDSHLVPCETWDNAVLLCECADPKTGEDFTMTLETKRMAPGQTNTWFIEIYGTEGSARFTTHDPRSIYTLTTSGKTQGWTRTDIGADFFIPSITGAIFETGLSDALQQMIGAFMAELDGTSTHPFPNGSVDETVKSHRILTAALRSHASGAKVAVA